MQYESLENEIQAKGVEVIHMRFSGNLKGLYADSTIAIDTKIETEAERCCVLAEEIGHHYTSLGNITNLEDIRNLKQEKKARNWAYEKLVGITGIINAFNAGTRNNFELAEYLGVTEEFLEETIKHYKEKHGLYYELDNYIVYFEPLGVLKMF
jgi:hypothetical protein